MQLAWSALTAHLAEQSAEQLAPHSAEQLKLPGLTSHLGAQVVTQAWTSVGTTEIVHWGAHVVNSCFAHDTCMLSGVQRVWQLSPGGSTWQWADTDTSTLLHAVRPLAQDDLLTPTKATMTDTTSHRCLMATSLC